MILWTDVETTGLDARRDLLLEVAAVVTDDKLVEVDAFTAVTELARMVDMKNVDPFVQQMHARNGLWNESLCSGQAVGVIEDMLVAFIMKHTPSVAPRREGAKDGMSMGGSTINFDRDFWASWLPRASQHLHYHNVDVTTMNELAKRLWPALYEGRPKEGESAHRALSDIRHSINVARYYVQGLVPFTVTSIPVPCAIDVKPSFVPDPFERKFY